MGEEEQFYLKDHHEVIVSREVWEAADAIRKERNKSVNMPVLSGSRERYTRQYALSSMCECGYCGNKLSRRLRMVELRIAELFGSVCVPLNMERRNALNVRQLMKVS